MNSLNLGKACSVLGYTLALCLLPIAAQAKSIEDAREIHPGVTSITSTSTIEQTTVVKATGGLKTLSFTFSLPKGAALRPLPAERGEEFLLSEIELVDANGKVIGHFDAAWAEDLDGMPLTSYFQIKGNTLLQTIDTLEAEGGAANATLLFTGVDVREGWRADDGGLPLQKAYVSVPSNYVYNPRLGSLHDYCTKSPDEFPNPAGANANFRGPCARHDLCYGGSTSKFTCDNRLRSDMRSNCAYTYAWYNPVRSACYRTADIYWAAVVIAT